MVGARCNFGGRVTLCNGSVAPQKCFYSAVHPSTIVLLGHDLCGPVVMLLLLLLSLKEALLIFFKLPHTTNKVVIMESVVASSNSGTAIGNGCVLLKLEHCTLSLCLQCE